MEITTPITPTEPAPIARVHGEPVTELPDDLYIPPEALSVILEAFEGPLDLLLYLIRKHSLDILDIPMADLTRQYMAYVEMMRATQLELAADYLLMAALLIDIKSRMLLPRPPRADDVEQDPRAALVKRLLEYEQMKLAAQNLDAMPQAGRDFALVSVWIEEALARPMPAVSSADLRSAWLGLLARAKVNRHHKVSREELSVRAHMSRILRELRNGDYLPFAALFDADLGVPVLIVTFLAILELAREALIEVSQTAPLQPIYLRLAAPVEQAAVPLIQ